MPPSHQIAVDEYYKYPAYQDPSDRFNIQRGKDKAIQIWNSVRPFVLLIPTLIILAICIRSVVVSSQNKQEIENAVNQVSSLYSLAHEQIFPLLKAVMDGVGLQIPRTLNEVKQLYSTLTTDNVNRIISKIENTCSMDDVRALFIALNKTDHISAINSGSLQVGVQINYNYEICYSESVTRDVGVATISGFTGFTPMSNNFLCTKIPSVTISSELYAVTYSIYAADCINYIGHYFEVGVLKDDGRGRPFAYKLASKIVKETQFNLSCSSTVHQRRGIFICSQYGILTSSRNISMLTLTMFTLYVDGYLERIVIPDSKISSETKVTSLIVSRSSGVSVGNTIYVSVLVMAGVTFPTQVICPTSTCHSSGSLSTQETCNKAAQIMSNNHGIVYQGVLEVISGQDGAISLDISIIPPERYRYARFADILYDSTDKTLIIVTDTSGWYPYSELIKLNIMTKEVISTRSLQRFRATIHDGCPSNDNCPKICPTPARFTPGLINYERQSISGLLAGDGSQTIHPILEIIYSETQTITRDFLAADIYILSSSTKCLYWYGTPWCIGFAEVNKGDKRVIAYQAWNVPTGCSSVVTT